LEPFLKFDLHDDQSLISVGNLPPNGLAIFASPVVVLDRIESHPHGEVIRVGAA
jgi:hypothetical protein